MAFTGAMLGAYSLLILASLIPARGDPLKVAIVLGAWAASLCLAALVFHYAEIAPARASLRNGVVATSRDLRAGESAFPLASIRQAEIMRFSGWHDCLAIEYVPTTGREALASYRIAEEDTDDLPRLRDVLREALGLPPQTRVRETTWKEWQRSIKEHGGAGSS